MTKPADSRTADSGRRRSRRRRYITAFALPGLTGSTASCRSSRDLRQPERATWFPAPRRSVATRVTCSPLPRRVNSPPRRQRFSGHLREAFSGRGHIRSNGRPFRPTPCLFRPPAARKFAIARAHVESPRQSHRDRITHDAHSPRRPPGQQRAPAPRPRRVAPRDPAGARTSPALGSPPRSARPAGRSPVPRARHQ